MARYSHFLGRRVEVQYRAGDIVLPASGLFVADSGRSIFLEQNIEQRGPKHFRWEIPYQCVVKIEQIAPQNALPLQEERAQSEKASVGAEENSASVETRRVRTALSAASGAGGGTLLTLNGKPKTA